MTPLTGSGDRGEVDELERLVRDALEHEASRAPLGANLVDSVAARVDGAGLRRRAGRLRSSSVRRPLVVLAAVLTLAVTVVGATLLFGRPGVALRPAGVISPSAASTPVAPLTTRVDLVGAGTCAGLTLRVEAPGGAVDAKTKLVTWVRPGVVNLLTVDGNDLRYLHAEGPCVDRLAYDVVGIDGPAGLQGASGTTGQRFNAERGIGLLVSASPVAARGRIDVRLVCRDGDDCPVRTTPVASIVVSVVAPFLGGQTTPATSRPDVTTTIVVTSGSETFTNRVVGPGGAPGAGRPVLTLTSTLSSPPPP